MNKNLMLVIIAVSLIPAFFNIGRGITGLAVNDSAVQAVAAQPAIARAPGHFLSGAVLIYFLVTIVLLSIAVSYLIALYHNNQKLTKVAKKNQVKHFEKMKSTFKGFNGIKFAKISDDKASQYVVAVVAIVGLVAILIMLLR
jgi:hypothetical protein